MFTRRGRLNFIFWLVATLVFMLACSISSGTPAVNPQPAFDATKAALELEATAMSLQLTQQALEAAPQIQPTDPPQLPPPTLPPPTDVPPPTPIPPTPTQDLESLIKNAKILVYEDTHDIGLWVKDALDLLGVRYTHVGDAQGDFLGALNSGTQWDLIIAASEGRSGVQGEFWDAIRKRVVEDKAALIAELWYLDSTANGRIKPLMADCGIKYQKDWTYAESIYFLEPSHPVFSTPHSGFSLLNYSTYWYNAGDLLKVDPGGGATLLAGTFQNRSSDYGVMATCFEGRVIFQTFCNHDFRRSDIVLLWQNYVTWVLTNRFNAIGQ